MPFTFSHPAIVLPVTFLPKRWYSLTGLVVGSITPDIEYLLSLKIHHSYSHTLPGFFMFDLPVGLLLVFLFHDIVRDSLFNNLPFRLKSRVSAFIGFAWNKYLIKNWIVVIASIMLGAASHLLWDSFTHISGYFVKIIPELTNKVGIIGYQIPIYKILQHSSSVIGGFVVLYALLNLPVETNVKRGIDLKYWIILICVIITTILIRMFFGLKPKLSEHMVMAMISAVFIALILTPVLLKLKKIPKST